MFKILIFEESLSNGANAIFSRYDVDVATTSDEFVNATFEKEYDLYLVNFYHYEVIDELKNSNDTTACIFIDEFYSIHNVKKAFLIADDYMVKPLYMEELKIRVDYHYRKLFTHSKNVILYKDFYFHVNSKQLYQGAKKIKLAPNEMKLLELFLPQVNKPLPRDVLYETLQSESYGSLRVYVSKLNKMGFDVSYDRSAISYSLLESIR